MDPNLHPSIGHSISSPRLGRFVLGGLCLFASFALHAASTTIAYDASGNTTAQQTASVGVPVIFAQPVSRLTEATGNAGFSVNVTSNSTVTYQWQFNNADIPGANGDSLYLPIVTAANEGTYRVIITNATGSVTSTVATLFLDSDADGMADNWEQTYFGSLSQTASGDYDGDRISNLDEYLNGTNPTVREVFHWIAAGGDFNNPANWDVKLVPAVGDTAIIATGTFTLPTSGTITASQVAVSIPFTAPTTADTTLAVTGSWSFTGPFTFASSRTFVVDGGGSVTISNSANIGVANLLARSGSTISLLGVTSYALSGANSLAWGAQNNGSKLIFPDLVSISGTLAPNRYLDLNTYYGTALISLPALTTITKTSDGDTSPNSGIRFNANDGGTISAPLLSAFNDNDSNPNSSLNAYGTSAVLVPQLLAPKGVNVALTALSDPGHFVSLQNATSLELTSGIAAMDNLSSIDGLSIKASGGASLTFPNVTTYVLSGPNSLAWTAQNSGSKLIFPDLVSISGTLAPNRYLDLSTYFGTALISLPALTTITKTSDGDTSPNSGIRFNANDGGTISAPLLSAFNDNDSHPNSSLNAYGTSAVLVPQLLAPKGVNVALTALSDPGHFVSLQNATSLELTSGTVTMSNLSSIDGLSIKASNGASLTLPNATSYTLNGTSNLSWEARNDGSKLVFPNLVTISGTTAPNRYFDINGYWGTALVSLPVLASITKSDDGDSGTNSGVRFTANDGSTISAPLLYAFNDDDSHPNSSLNRYGTSVVSLASLHLSGIRGVTLNGVVLLGDPPVVGLQPVDQTTAAPGTATFTLTATGTPPLGYQWQRKPAGLAVWTDLANSTTYAGTTTTTLTVSSTSPAMNGDQFQCVVSNGVPPSVTSNAVTLTVRATSTDWKNSHFTAPELAQPSVSGLLADPDGDGLANLLEYGLCLEPRFADPTKGVTLGTNGGALSLTYTRRKNPADLTYTVEVSSDLTTWQSGPAFTLEQSATSLDAEREQVVVVDLTPMAGSAKRFMRVRVNFVP